MDSGVSEEHPVIGKQDICRWRRRPPPAERKRIAGALIPSMWEGPENKGKGGPQCYRQSCPGSSSHRTRCNSTARTDEAPAISILTAKIVHCGKTVTNNMTKAGKPDFRMVRPSLGPPSGLPMQAQR